VIGERDLADGSVQLKTMETGEQVSVPLAQVVSDVINTLKLSKDGRNQQ
jgi:histidyl-tRNA synthetase